VAAHDAGEQAYGSCHFDPINPNRPSRSLNFFFGSGVNPPYDLGAGALSFQKILEGVQPPIRSVGARSRCCEIVANCVCSFDHHSPNSAFSSSFVSRPADEHPHTRASQPFRQVAKTAAVPDAGLEVPSAMPQMIKRRLGLRIVGARFCRRDGKTI
jgi:hypothetical protein